MYPIATYRSSYNNSGIIHYRLSWYSHFQKKSLRSINFFQVYVVSQSYLHAPSNESLQKGGLEKSIQIRSITYGSSTAAAGHQHRDLLLMSNSSGPLGDRSLFDEWIGRQRREVSGFCICDRHLKHQNLGSFTRNADGLHWCSDFFCMQIWLLHTLQGTNISHQKSLLKMVFLFPRWDVLIPWRVYRIVES